MSANGSGDGVRAGGEPFVVGGLPVPPELAGLIRAGKWVPPAADVLRRIFDDEPVQPCFYSESVLVRENRDWHTETDPVWLGDPADERTRGSSRNGRSRLRTSVRTCRSCSTTASRSPLRVCCT